MNKQERDQVLDCRIFQLNLYHFQADELSDAERRPLQDHLDGCEICARRLAVEDDLLRCLRQRLRRAPAPAELQWRVRSALREARGASSWMGLRRPWLTAAAASVLLLVLLVPGMRGLFQGRSSPGERFGLEREVTLVDLDCDRAGASLEQQRRCHHPHHINALRLASGEHWNLSLDGADARLLALRHDMRGHRLRVQGDFVPALRALRLTRFSDLGFP